MLPGSTDPRAAQTAVDTWLEAYAKDPAAGYREAPEPVRLALDRRLLADAIQKSLEKQVEERPGDASALAEAALVPPPRSSRAGRAPPAARAWARPRRRWPRCDRPRSRIWPGGSATRSKTSGPAASSRPGSNDRRKNRLSATDAEGRVLLASSYEKLLGDRAAAADLLREALAIDPESRPAVDAFLRMGYRKGERRLVRPRRQEGRGARPEADRDPGQPDRPAERIRSGASPAPRSDPGSAASPT